MKQVYNYERRRYSTTYRGRKSHQQLDSRIIKVERFWYHRTDVVDSKARRTASCDERVGHHWVPSPWSSRLVILSHEIWSAGSCSAAFVRDRMSRT